MSCLKIHLLTYRSDKQENAWSTPQPSALNLENLLIQRNVL